MSKKKCVNCDHPIMQDAFFRAYHKMNHELDAEERRAVNMFKYKLFELCDRFPPDKNYELMNHISKIPVLEK